MRKLSIVILGAVVSVLTAPNGLACSICHCGDPTFSLVGSQVFVPNTWHLGLDAERYAKDQVAEDDPGAREKEVENRLTLSGTYTIGARLTLVARLPFADRTISASGERASLSGFSDPELLVHYRLLAPRPGFWVSVTAGVRPGWGRSDGQQNGQRAEEHLQPGSGAAGAEAGLSFAQVVGAANDGSLFGSLSGRVNGRNDAEYHYGNALLANLGYVRRLGGRLNGIVELSYRYAAKDEPAVGEKDPNTGGSVLYVSPRILVKLDKSLFLRLGVQIPVVKGLYGDQDEKVNLLSGLTVRF